MKCYVCSFEGDAGKFGILDISGGGMYMSIIAQMPDQHIGSVKIFVCPDCGALHTNMRGAIANKDRIE